VVWEEKRNFRGYSWGTPCVEEEEEE